MAGIFINYRRVDSAAYAGRLGDALFRRYGRQSVFLDIQSIEPGMDFVRHIEEAVRTSSVMLVVVGPRWLEGEGGGRLKDPDDFIRLEIASALKSGKPIIPVLVGGAPFPRAESLPEELRGLTRYNAFRLDDDTWADDLKNLYRILDTSLRGDRPSIGPLAAIVRFLREVLSSFFRAPREVASTPRPLPDGRRAAREYSTPRRHEVFISHAKEDRGFVESVVAALEGEGFPCWVSYRDIPAGEPSWAGAIAGAIATSRLIVIVVSRHSNASKQVLREVSIADDENIPYIPFRVDDSPLSNDFKFFFSTTQRLDAARLSHTAALNLLTSTVKQRALAAASHTAKPPSS